ncbi:MAG: M48 family metalloprotease [Candidatus Saccharibacteria bacterium]|nr:M48 family metalloprotease [Candidatus Saccharibacteria bacterium]
MYSAIRANKRNTIIIMMVFLLVIGGLGALIGYLCNDMTYAYTILVIAAMYAFIEYFFASRLAISMSGGKEISKEDNPLLWNTVENLSIASGMPMPRVFIIDDSAPNAFATGRNPKHAYVAATTGLLEIMDKRELNGVMAHEMSHIQNYDIRVSMIIFGLTCAFGYVADIFLRAAIRGSRDDDGGYNIFLLVFALIAYILTPIVSLLVQLAVSRQREYLADSSAALLTRDPQGMVNALTKLEANTKPMHRQNSAMSHLYINEPGKKSSFLSNIFSTHPPISDRIARLQTIGERM